MNRLEAITIECYLFLIMGCVSSSLVITNPEYKLLTELPEERRYKVFNELSTEQQLEVHFAAMNQVNPPDTSFADQMAEHRQKIILFLIEKIKFIVRNMEILPKQSVNDKTQFFTLRKQQADILLILSRMVKKYGCSLNMTREQITFIFNHSVYAHDLVESNEISNLA